MVESVDTSQRDLEHNVRLIPLHHGLAHSLVWIPVFVLFSRARFDLDGALLLASIYYLFVVVLEVPSGWMSDRIGRVFTLRVAALCWTGAHLCFALGDDRFLVILAGQLLLAAGFASLSGTDVAFHYDTLEALGRAETYTERQARVSSIGYIVGGLSAAAGGALGLIDLRWAFVASVAIAILQFLVTLQLSEPPSNAHAERFVQQLAMCVGYLRNRYVGWIFFYGVIMVTLVHVAFTLMQPWLTEVLGKTPEELGATPVLAGAIFATVGFIGAAAARSTTYLSRRLGVVTTMIALAAVSSAVVTAMALWVHLAVLSAVAFRSVQGAVAPILISAELAPRTQRQHRATLLSMKSLAGRLGYGLVLLFVAADAADDVQHVLAILAILAWSLVAVLIITALWATADESASNTTTP